ncbi:MAG: 4Fe-4S binding protein [Phycisphaerales bacterium]|nr:4Fe-4S binding protein [Phycisphaerales bacterium]
MTPRPDLALPQVTPGTSPPRPRRQYVRWRVASLIGVHVLFAIHVAHWRLAGKTVAPLELNEVMHTLELGVVTAGFVLMALIVLSVTVFGRFFCSWGCHILALQDLCAGILRKLRIRAKPVRSRVLLLVAPGAMLYMFVWPQVSRLIEGRPRPTLRLLDDTGGWASFVTDDFWRNLPGPGMALLTLFVCGFAIVYVLGTRSFCQYACPYGAVFGIMDRFAPGRIKVDPDKCTQCGVCTGVCESHVRVHEEIARHGRVVDAACLKDLDCVTACPEQALSYGWTQPSLLASLRPGRRRLPYDFTVGEDVLMVAVFVVGLATFRGLYGRVPFLLALAVSGILAYFAVLALRLDRRPNVRFNRFQLKVRGRVTRQGRAFAVMALLVLAAVLHSGFIRYHEVRGGRALKQAEVMFARGDDGADVEVAARRALGHFDLCARWGLLTAPGHHARTAAAWWGAGDAPAAERSWSLAIEQDPEDQDSRLKLAASLLQRGRADLAQSFLRQVTTARERSEKDAGRYAHYRGSAWHMLGSLASARGDLASARAAFDAAAVEERRLRSLTGTSP